MTHIQTHHPRCFLDRSHHACAVAYALDLERAVLAYRAADAANDHGAWSKAQRTLFGTLRVETLTRLPLPRARG